MPRLRQHTAHGKLAVFRSMNSHVPVFDRSSDIPAGFQGGLILRYPVKRLYVLDRKGLTPVSPA